MVTEWDSDGDLETVITCLEKMDNHLTAALVSSQRSILVAF